MNYAKALRILRASRGLSQKLFAEKLGVTPSYMSLLESDDRKPSVDFLERTASSFGIPLHLLFILGADEKELHGIDFGTATAALHQVVAGKRAKK